MLLPLLTDEFKGRESPEHLVALGKVVCQHEGRQMLTKLLMRIVVVAIEGRLFERVVHAFHLPVRLRMAGLGQPAVVPAPL